MKIRRLALTKANDEDTVSLLYQGFMLGGDKVNGNASKGMEVTRREARMIEKFEKIGDLIGDRFVMRDEHAELTLDQPQYEMLKRYFEAAPWATRMSKTVERISDSLANLPVEDTKDG